MLSKFRLLATIFLIGSCLSLQANSVPTEPITQISRTSNEDVCNLLAPAFLSVIETGTSWASLAWAPVPGAYQFHIITRDVNNGNVLSDVYAPGTTNGKLITGLPPGSTCISEIRSVCQNGEESLVPRYSPQFGIIVIDVVTSSFVPKTCLVDDHCTLPIKPSFCQIPATVGSSSVFKIIPPNGLEKHFKVTKGNDGVHVSPDTEGPGSNVFSFENDGGANIYVRLGPGGPSIAHISTSASAVQKLFRIGDAENMTYQIVRMAYTCFTDPGDREEEQESTNKDNKHLSASPNPFSDLLDVQIPFSTEENDVTLSLYDLQGRLVISQKSLGGPQIRSLSTQDLIPGLYLLRVDTGDKSETIKVVKTQ